MRWLRKKADARLVEVGESRLALVEPFLWVGEKVLHNAPAEALVKGESGVVGQPVILFATDQRLILVPYSGRSDYGRDESAPYPLIPLPYGDVALVAANRARGRAGRWKAVGAIVLPHMAALSLPPSASVSIMPGAEALMAASGAFGAFGADTIERVVMVTAAINPFVLVLGFPIFTSKTADLLDYAANKTSA